MVIIFEETEFTINEDVGYVELCLVMIEPPASETFSGAFFLTVESQNGTATGISKTCYVKFIATMLTIMKVDYLGVATIMKITAHN